MLALALPFVVVGRGADGPAAARRGLAALARGALLRPDADQHRLLHRAVSRAEPVPCPSRPARRDDRRRPRLVLVPISKADRARIAYPRALLAILLPLPVAAAVVYLGTHILRDYGWSLFVGLPFVLPMLSVVIYGFGRNVTLGQCLAIGCALDPRRAHHAGRDGLRGVDLHRHDAAARLAGRHARVRWSATASSPSGPAIRRSRARSLLVLFALVADDGGRRTPRRRRSPCSSPARPRWWSTPRPRTSGGTSSASPTSTRRTTGSSVRAWPTRSAPGSRGPASARVRRCEFSTGAFVEPIEVWDEPRLLRFAVTSNPAPMREWNPLFEIHPPHLDGFLVSKRGQFLLTPLPGGKTLLRGSTLYQHGLWPAAYWRLWSDPIIHRIHDRVLRHIKTLAESSRTS